MQQLEGNHAMRFLGNKRLENVVRALGFREGLFILFEAGHIAQNISLTATALELGSVVIGGFLDDKINDLIGVNGVDEAVLYLIALGRPRTN